MTDWWQCGGCLCQWLSFQCLGLFCVLITQSLRFNPLNEPWLVAGTASRLHLTWNWRPDPNWEKEKWLWLMLPTGSRKNWSRNSRYCYETTPVWGYSDSVALTVFFLLIFLSSVLVSQQFYTLVDSKKKTFHDLQFCSVPLYSVWIDTDAINDRVESSKPSTFF